MKQIIVGSSLLIAFFIIGWAIVSRATVQEPISSAWVGMPSDPIPYLVLHEIAESAKDPQVIAQANTLADVQAHFNEVKGEFDDAHRLYAQRLLAKAPKSELESYRRQLDAYLDEMREDSQNVYRLTSELTRKYVQDRLK